MTTEQSTKRWLPATLLIAACAMFAGCTADGDVPPGGVADDGGGDGGGKESVHFPEKSDAVFERGF